MNRRDFQSAVPPIPAHFVHAVDAALAQIGRAENTHVHRVREKHLSRRILIAAAALLLLAGMALAVGARFGGVARAVADRAQRRLLFEPAEDVARPEAEQQSAHLGQ